MMRRTSMFPLGTGALVTVCWASSITILAFGAWLVCYAPNCVVTSLDATLLDWFAQQRNEAFDSFFRIVTWLGSIVVLVPPVVTGMLLLTFYKRISEGLFLGVALFGTIVIVHVSKLVAVRPRPPIPAPQLLCRGICRFRALIRRKFSPLCLQA